MTATPTDALLTVEGLEVEFPTRRGAVKAVRDVSLSLQPGEALGIVGESGSGKSVTALAMMGLVQSPGRVTAGEIRFRGRDLTKLPERELRAIRGSEIAMIFQDPMTSMNPVVPVGTQVGEPLRIHRGVGRAPARVAAIEMLGSVGISDPKLRSSYYPHQFSGGMRQRAMAGMGLIAQPAVLLADEPTTALDVTIQRQILDLLRKLSRDSETAIVLISHNFGVVAGLCDRVAVMYAGRIIEHGATEAIFAEPQHPYTRALLRAVPRIDLPQGTALEPIPGSPPDLENLPTGCAFAPRCSLASEKCRVSDPELQVDRNGHATACWAVDAPGATDA